MNTLPPSLVRFESQLENAIHRQRSRRPRRLAFRFAAAGSAAAAIGLGVLSVLPGEGVLPGTGPSAVARAAAVLAPAKGTILHTVVRTTSVHPDGSTDTGTTETWQQTSLPYDHRTVSGSGNARRETASVDGSPQAYVALTNTVYTVFPGTELPPPRPSSDGGQGLVDRLRVLLASGGAREAGRVTVAGRDAVRIVLSPTGTLVVDAVTYEPIEWSAVSDEGIRETGRVTTYERLPATEAALAALDLTARYPNATVEPGITVEGFGPDPDKERDAGTVPGTFSTGRARKSLLTASRARRRKPMPGTGTGHRFYGARSSARRTAGSARESATRSASSVTPGTEGTPTT